MERFPYPKEFADGRVGYVMPLTFGRGRLCVGRVEDWAWVLDGW